MDGNSNTGSHVDEQRQKAEHNHPDHYVGKSPIKVNKLGHMVYEVTDVERTAKFWSEVMGFEETDRNAIGMVFFRCGADHHAIGLKPAKAKTRPQGDEALKVEHLALEVDNLETLFRTRDYLEQNNIPVVFQGRKGAGGNAGLHFCDPDGFEFELYCGMDQVDDGGLLRPEEQFHRVSTLEEARDNPLPPKKW
ncbi:VOC family protein [Alphaproteobacteria bacterium]|nr:VOC family protein [Alphaproteobacteria bacterium]